MRLEQRIGAQSGGPDAKRSLKSKNAEPVRFGIEKG
jgi:hypothetical protein